MERGRGLTYVMKRGCRSLQAVMKMVLSPAILEKVTRLQEGSGPGTLGPQLRAVPLTEGVCIVGKVKNETV